MTHGVGNLERTSQGGLEMLEIVSSSSAFASSKSRIVGSTSVSEAEMNEHRFSQPSVIAGGRHSNRPGRPLRNFVSPALRFRRAA